MEMQVLENLAVEHVFVISYHLLRFADVIVLLEEGHSGTVQLVAKWAEYVAGQPLLS